MLDSNFYISNSDNREVTASLLFRKLWLLIVLVLVILIGLDYVFMKEIVFTNEFSNQGKVKRLLENKNANDIPVFGASLARSSFIPDSISPNCYNYGMGKALFDVTRVLFKIECEKDKDAPIIFELNQRTFIKSPQTSINSSTFIPLLEYPLIEQFMKESDVFNWHYKVPGMRLYGNYIEYGAAKLRRKAGKKEDNRGVMLESKAQTEEDVTLFTKRLYNMRDMRLELMEKNADETQSFTFMDAAILNQINSSIYFSYDTAYVAEFENYVSSNPRRKFIMVTVPMNPNFYEAMPNIQEFTDFANKLADKYDNLYYLDYLQEMNLEIEDFKDPMHFSTKGSERFNHIFHKDFEKITGIKQDGSRSIN